MAKYNPLKMEIIQNGKVEFEGLCDPFSRDAKKGEECFFIGNTYSILEVKKVDDLVSIYLSVHPLT